MKKLLIVGGGSFSTEVEELARLLGYTDFGFVDDQNPACASPIIGKMKDLEKIRCSYEVAIVALGNNENRKKYHEELKKLKYDIPILVHPTAYVSPDAALSPGCIIRTHAVVSRYAKLGEGVIVNIGGIIDHHCEIGDFSMILPGAVVRNNAKIGQETWVRANGIVE